MDSDAAKPLENAIEQAIAEGKLNQARERLNELLPIAAETPPEAVCRIELLFAEVLARLGQAPLARGRLIRAGVYPEILAANPLLKLRELRVRLWLGEVELLADELSACDRALEERGDLASRTLLMCEEGQAWNAKGNLDRAGECWAQAEEWSRSLGADTCSADLLIQLGRLEHARDNYQAALERYSAALARAVFQSQRQEAALRRLLVLLDLGQVEQARACWKQALGGKCLEEVVEELQPLAEMVQALMDQPIRSQGRGVLAQARVLLWQKDMPRRFFWAACRYGNAAEVFRFHETEKNRELQRLSRRSLPVVTDLGELQRSLPPETVYLSPILVYDELCFLVCRRRGRAEVVRCPGSAYGLEELVEEFWLGIERRRESVSPAQVERAELDRLLGAIGHSCLGNGLGRVLERGETGERIIWVPDGMLHGFPLHALRLGGRYLIETHEVAYTLSGSFLVHQAQTPVRRRLLTRALVLCESSDVLPTAEQEADAVVGTFRGSRVLRGANASRAALTKYLPEASVLHLACQAWLDGPEPSASHVRLPSGETWGTQEWLNEALVGLPLVTVGTCRLAEGSSLTGREVTSLVTGLLANGVRSVVTGLWPISDREVLRFMSRFYHERMTADVPTAMARAQREAIRQGDISPSSWAAFAFFGDPDALPRPSRWLRWLARWRQARHARRFLLRQNEGSS